MRTYLGPLGITLALVAAVYGALHLLDFHQADEKDSIILLIASAAYGLSVIGLLIRRTWSLLSLGLLLTFLFDIGFWGRLAVSRLFGGPGLTHEETMLARALLIVGGFYVAIAMLTELREKIRGRNDDELDTE